MKGLRRPLAATLEKMPVSLQINPAGVERLGLPGVCANNTQRSLVLETA